MQVEHSHYLERNNILCVQILAFSQQQTSLQGIINYRFVLAQLYVSSLFVLFLAPDLVNAINNAITIAVVLSLPYLIRTLRLPELSQTALPSAEGL
jgi:hypothetical protein